MFSKKQGAAGAARTRGAKAGLSLIGPEVTINGDVASEGALHIDGRVDGQVRCTALYQGDNGVIAGDISAEDVRIGGLAQGKVTGGTVTIEASGRIAGDVSYDTISIAAGAQVEGRLARRDVLPGDSAGLVVLTPTAASESAPTEATLFSSRPTRLKGG